MLCCLYERTSIPHSSLPLFFLLFRSTLSTIPTPHLQNQDSPRLPSTWCSPRKGSTQVCTPWRCCGPGQEDMCHLQSLSGLGCFGPQEGKGGNSPSSASLYMTTLHSLTHARLSPVSLASSSLFSRPRRPQPSLPTPITWFPSTLLPGPGLSLLPLTRRSRRVSTLSPIMSKCNPPQMLTF